MADPLAEMLDHAEHHARTMLIGSDDQLLPLFDLRDAAGQNYAIERRSAGTTRKR
jgi:hypothetical protein